TCSAGRPSPPGAEGSPFEAAVRALEGAVDVVVGGVAGAGVGFRQRHLVVDVRVVMTQAAAARRTGPPGFHLTEPAFHGCNLPVMWVGLSSLTKRVVRLESLTYGVSGWKA